ncbi:MAG TPA: threonine/serine dehydratase, partial [bacterium]|nr:threonine/serine dehydratase [bacterium]
MIQIQDILNAYKTVQPIVHKTPLMQSHALDEKTGNAVFFKCENFQKVGAFKIRGAYNKIASLSAEQKAKGVVAFSSGNHAQGVALASRLLGTTSKIVMPDNSPKSKMEATRAYGAEVIVYDFLKEDREAIGKRISESEGRTLVPPFNDEYIMAGQGTVSVELVEQISDLDYAFIPCGGGGL